MPPCQANQGLVLYAHGILVREDIQRRTRQHRMSANDPRLFHTAIGRDHDFNLYRS